MLDMRNHFDWLVVLNFIVSTYDKQDIKGIYVYEVDLWLRHLGTRWVYSSAFPLRFSFYLPVSFYPLLFIV
jgi:hypothetical protein